MPRPYARGPTTIRVIGAFTEAFQAAINASTAMLVGWFILFSIYGIALLAGKWVLPAIGIVGTLQMVRYALEQQWVKEGTDQPVILGACIGSVLLILALTHGQEAYEFLVDYKANWRYIAIPFLVEAVLEFSIARQRMQFETADSYAFGETELRKSDDYNVPASMVGRIERARRKRDKWRSGSGS